MQPLQVLQQLLDSALLAFNDNPVVLSLQAGIITLGCIGVYLLAYTVRDVILRTKSLPYQLACIVLVAALPIVGFFLYLLVRPARTVKERRMERLLKEVLEGEKKIAHSVDHNFTAKQVVQQTEKKKGNLLQSMKKEKASASA